MEALTRTEGGVGGGRVLGAPWHSGSETPRFHPTYSLGSRHVT